MNILKHVATYLATSCIALILVSCDARPPSIKSDAVLLKVTHIRQETMLCVPTSAAMILDYYSDKRSPRELKLLASGKPLPADGRFSDFTVTYYADLIRGLAKIGYDWEQIYLSDSHADFRKGLDQIKSELKAGRPVMVDMSIPEGHTVVVVGFDDASISVVDPNQAAPGQYKIDMRVFEAQWNEHAYGNSGRAMIMTKPRSKS